MSPLTNALIRYWQRLPAESTAARRHALDSACQRVSAGIEARSALLPYALGDTDDDIVGSATLAYVGADVAGSPGAFEAIDDAADWVRRGLALNRGAVFGALLAHGEGRILERLAALRLGLSAAEVEVACRVLGPAPDARAVEFLLDWLALLADGPLQRERRALATAVQGWERARAA
jgi:hypothetical protein